jgi:16S rRNA G966 N2-methylase RsmD
MCTFTLGPNVGLPWTCQQSPSSLQTIAAEALVAASANAPAAAKSDFVIVFMDPPFVLTACKRVIEFRVSEKRHWLSGTIRGSFHERAP